MNRNFIIGLGLFALAAVVALLIAGRNGPKPTTQDTTPQWKLIVNAPNTNTNVSLPNTNTPPRPK